MRALIWFDYCLSFGWWWCWCCGGNISHLTKSSRIIFWWWFHIQIHINSHSHTLNKDPCTHSNEGANYHRPRIIIIILTNIVAVVVCWAAVFLWIRSSSSSLKPQMQTYDIAALLSLSIVRSIHWHTYTHTHNTLNTPLSIRQFFSFCLCVLCTYSALSSSSASTSPLTATASTPPDWHSLIRDPLAML